MMDYFAPDAGNGASGEANGAAPVAAAPVAAAGGEGMVEDEIMVRTLRAGYDTTLEADNPHSNLAFMLGRMQDLIVYKLHDGIGA